MIEEKENIEEKVAEEVKVNSENSHKKESEGTRSNPFRVLWMAQCFLKK